MPKIGISLLLFLVTGLVLATVMSVYAQGPEPEEEPETTDVGSQNIGGLGLSDPAPAGLSTLYMFSGVANDDTDQDLIATSVLCTNFGSTSVQVELQLFDHNDANVYTASTTIASNHTWTASSQNTPFREDANLNTGLIEQGSGRVLADQVHLICTTQVLNPDQGAGTVFISKLPLYDSNGQPAGKLARVYLPIILK
ncbi:MAG TPA: hypothetical protein VGD99_26485 [Anaerolineae bacterium]|jgi:hypothetical protein